ncbi:helix-turn-helix transcriptional regulator [Providencia alcalifaciens]|uniref:helix-turn-helix transcriptional regulator n=1 Tax=Providencia alcalifaciens TaxID=126385 RepID=UPI0032DA9889
MSIDYSQKLLAIRKAEKLTQQQFSDLTGISLSSIKKYETSHQPAGASTMEAVINNQRFKKYALWLAIGETSESIGQISPTLSPDGQGNKTLSHSERKTG